MSCKLHEALILSSTVNTGAVLDGLPFHTQLDLPLFILPIRFQSAPFSSRYCMMGLLEDIGTYG